MVNELWGISTCLQEDMDPRLVSSLPLPSGVFYTLHCRTPVDKEVDLGVYFPLLLKARMQVTLAAQSTLGLLIGPTIPRWRQNPYSEVRTSNRSNRIRVFNITVLEENDNKENEPRNLAQTNQQLH